MLTRRSALASLAASLALPAAAFAQAPARPAAAPVANDPAALLTRLYTKAAKDNAGGDFYDSKERAKYLSKSFAALWSKAEAATPKGDAGPIDFDPVSNSQDPDIKSFAIKVEKQDDGSATLAVALIGSQTRKVATDSVIRYDFVRDGAHWRIDDIRGSVDGKPWSVRELLKLSLKS
jgi:hypothetical protein